MYDYDVVCIGGGPGGSASAMRCADRGKKVALIEARTRNGSGGTCVNRGCIPTKALMASANLYASIKEAAAFGINVDMSAVTVDFKAIDKRKNQVINGLGFGLEAMLWKKARGITVIKGRARLLDAHTIEVDNGKTKKTVTAENIVIAVGSEPAEIPAFHVDHEKIITSNEIMDFSRPLPGSIVIIGSGAIGLEYGHIYSIYGVDVTIVEMMPNLVPALHDTEITDAVKASLEKRGVKVKCGSGIAAVEVQPDGKVKSTLANGEELWSDEVLVAIGRTLNTRGMGLEEVGVKMEKNGQIVTDEHMRTSVPDVYAAGDAAGLSGIWPNAALQGEIAAKNMCGVEAEYTDRYAMKNTMNFFGLTTLSLGPTAVKEGDEVLTAESRSGYAKAIIRGDALVHLTIQGDIGNTGFWQEIIKRGINPRTPGKSLAELSYADFWKYDEANGKYAWD